MSAMQHQELKKIGNKEVEMPEDNQHHIISLSRDDLASIAGILVVIGTGLDHQIIILDEINLGKIYGWKEKMRRAFFIIVGAFATTFVAMLPLAWAGAGLLKGFAVTTIIGITVGILITRPAFADMIKKILKN